MKAKNMKYLKLLTILCFVLSFSSCKVENIGNLAPQWFQNPRQNDENFIYGVGSGKSLEDAKKVALSNVIERISVVVNSSFKSEVVGTNVGQDSQIRQNIELSIPKTEISDYQIINSEVDKVNGEKLYFLEVSIKKNEFYLAKKIEFDNTIKSLREYSLAQNNAVTIFDKVKYSKNISEIITKAKNQITVLRGLKSSFNYSEALIEIGTYLNQINILPKTAVVFVSSNDKLAQVIFENYLVQLEVDVSSKMDNYNQNLVIAKLVVDKKIQKAYKSFISNNVIDITYFDRIGKKQMNYQIKFSGSSILTSDIAYQIALNDLKNQLEKKKPFPL